ncbi:cytochrome P450 [Nonomuraea sp. NPDC049695]|uniref:cytochrome P450 n=1 Tax=Nonomuraea sp. NPDC049695 TaxID=3154734 RepID=UPI003446B541
MTQAPELPPLQMRRNGFDPVEELAQARDGNGVVRVDTPFGPPAYLVCRYEDVRRVLSDAARFSSARSPFPGSGEVNEDEDEETTLRAGQLIGFDPPEHTRLRRMLTPEFTVRRMRRLEPRITEIVQAALDDLEKAGKPADLVAPRAQADPSEDMLGMLVREHGDDLSTDELIGIAGLLLLAGHETTSNMLALGTLALLRHPDQLAMIRDDPARIEPAIEELLRWLTVVQTLPPRTTTTEVEIAGQAIPAGSLVICSLPAANRDRALIDDPDTLDIVRGAAGHVAFGHGVHHCLGAPLARMEMRIALPRPAPALPRPRPGRPG